MKTAICVKDKTGHFTLLEDYEVIAKFEKFACIKSNAGYIWQLSDECDGYYGCVDANGNHVSFLIEA